MNAPNSPPSVLGSPKISPRELARDLGVTPAVVSGWVASGRLPRPVKISNKTKFWPRAQIEDFLAGRSS